MDESLQNNEWISTFQGLRGIAILLIFISHCRFSNNRFDQNATSWFGAAGVSLFLILSGYLFYLKTEQQSIDRKFIQKHIGKKLKKLYPLHLFTFFISVPFYTSILLSSNLFIRNSITVLCNLLLLQSWVPYSEIYFSFNAVSWFLSTILSTEMIVLFLTKLTKGMRKKKCTKEITTFTILCYLLLACIFNFIIFLIPFSHKFNLHWFVYIFPITRIIDFSLGGDFSIAKKIVKHIRKKYKYNLSN